MPARTQEIHPITEQLRQRRQRRVRERLGVAPRELRALAPEASEAACAAAARLLDAVVVDTLTERKAVLWGHELQKAHGDRVTGTLALAQDPLVEQARGHLGRMIEILGALDLQAVCGHERGGLLGSLGRSLGGRIDTPARLARALDELRLLLDRLEAAIDRLLDLADRLRRHAGAFAEIEGEVEAAALAALYLSNHLAARSPGLAQRFTERAMSLTATVAQLRQGEAVRRLQLEQPLQLTGAIQNVALVTLPGFVAALAALLTAARTRGASPTEAREMSYQLRGILDQLATQEGVP